MEMSKNVVPSIKLSDAERILASLRAHADQLEGVEDLELSFEYMLTAMFPTCWENIKAEMNRQYTAGFIAGQNEPKI